MADKKIQKRQIPKPSKSPDRLSELKFPSAINRNKKSRKHEHISWADLIQTFLVLTDILRYQSPNCTVKKMSLEKHEKQFLKKVVSSVDEFYKHEHAHLLAMEQSRMLAGLYYFLTTEYDKINTYRRAKKISESSLRSNFQEKIARYLTEAELPSEPRSVEHFVSKVDKLKYSAEAGGAVESALAALSSYLGAHPSLRIGRGHSKNPLRKDLALLISNFTRPPIGTGPKSKFDKGNLLIWLCRNILDIEPSQIPEILKAAKIDK